MLSLERWFGAVRKLTNLVDLEKMVKTKKYRLKRSSSTKTTWYRIWEGVFHFPCSQCRQRRSVDCTSSGGETWPNPWGFGAACLTPDEPRACVSLSFLFAKGPFWPLDRFEWECAVVSVFRAAFPTPGYDPRYTWGGIKEKSWSLHKRVRKDGVCYLVIRYHERGGAFLKKRGSVSKKKENLFERGELIESFLFENLGFR